MSQWSSGRLRVALAAVCLTAGACSGGDDGGDPPPVPDASPASCEPAGQDAEPFELRIGIREGEDQHYVELGDGDVAKMALGFQGLFMLLLASEATLPVDAEEFCMHCAAELSPSSSTSFDGDSMAADVPFKAVGSGAFRGSLTFILGSETERPQFEGAEVTLSVSCGREEFAGSAERDLTLEPP
jgi:hypothetical protein